MSGREFDGRPFVAGDLTGIRAFRVDADGMLTGVVHEQRWVAGANTAVCLVSPFHGVVVSMSESLTGRKRPPHHVAGVGCACGFYAYFKGKNSYIDSVNGGQVAGVVKGYGVCTVGSRGFRAERAHLVAIIEPRRHRFLTARVVWAAYARRVNSMVGYPIHQGTHRLARRLIANVETMGRRARFATWLTGRCLRVAQTGQALIGLTIAVAAIWLLDGWAGHLTWLLGMSVMWARTTKGVNTTPTLSPAEFAVVRGRYPTVPVYRSRRAAVAAHPLTRPDQGTP